MSGMDVYFIIKAEDKEEALYDVEYWLEEHMDEEFYGRYKISPTDVKQVSEFEPGFFERLLRECEERATECRKDIEKYRTQNDRWNEGCAHKSLSNILMKSFSENMPYWNLVTDNWDLPKNKDYWAVTVTLY